MNCVEIKSNDCYFTDIWTDGIEIESVLIDVVLVKVMVSWLDVKDGTLKLEGMLNLKIYCGELLLMD